MTKKNILPIALATILILILGFGLPARAQDQNQLTLSMSRDFGFASGGQIQGTFSMKVSGPSNLVKVDFMIDGKTIFEATQAPFKVQFTTDSYPLGTHVFSAVGYLSDGTELHSQEFSREFVTASQGWQVAGRIIIPILAITVVIILVTTVIPLVSGGRGLKKLEPGTPRSYKLGGTICPKCQRPFDMPILGLNLFTGKFTRCPFCGKWSMVHYKSMSELRAAEQTEMERANEKPTVQGETDAEKLKKEMDDSRYQNL